VAVRFGKWVYEIKLLGKVASVEPDEFEWITGFIAQIGWATTKFFSADYSEMGCGDDRASWGFDGYRQLLFHGLYDHEVHNNTGYANNVAYGKTQWKAGDVVGLAIDVGSPLYAISLPYGVPTNVLSYPSLGVEETRLEFFINGESQGIAPISISTKQFPSGFMPSFTLGTSSRDTGLEMSFGGSSPLTHTYEGYNAIGGNELHRFISHAPEFQLGNLRQMPVIFTTILSKSLPNITHSFKVVQTSDAIQYMRWDSTFWTADISTLPTGEAVWVHRLKHQSQMMYYSKVIHYLKWDKSFWKAYLIANPSGAIALHHVKATPTISTEGEAKVDNDDGEQPDLSTGYTDTALTVR
jgi:hypothetical protein